MSKSAYVTSFVEYPHFKLRDLVQSSDKRPCQLSQELYLTSTQSNLVTHLQFRNYYCGWITVMYKNKNSLQWCKTSITRKKLMEDPHHENDAQKYWNLDLRKYTGLWKELRLIYEQPSPNWRTVCVRNVKLFEMKKEKREVSSVEQTPNNQNENVDEFFSIGDRLFSTMSKIKKYNLVLESYRNEGVSTSYGKVINEVQPSDRDIIVNLSL